MSEAQKLRRSLSWADKCAGVATLVLYGAALCFPTIGTCVNAASWGAAVPQESINWFSNSTVLFFGWMGLFFFQPAWLANIALAFCYTAALQGRRVVALLALSPVALGACMFLRLELPHHEGFAEKTCLHGIGTGAWIWLAIQSANSIYFLLRSMFSGKLTADGSPRLGEAR